MLVAVEAGEKNRQLLELISYCARGREISQRSIASNNRTLEASNLRYRLGMSLPCAPVGQKAAASYNPCLPTRLNIPTLEPGSTQLRHCESCAGEWGRRDETGPGKRSRSRSRSRRRTRNLDDATRFPPFFCSNFFFSFFPHHLDNQSVARHTSHKLSVPTYPGGAPSRLAER